MRSVVVETGLAEEAEWNGQSYTRHARTRFVSEAKPELQQRSPELGDPWCPLTVRARLHRVNWVLRRDPKVQPQQLRSCMPEPVREMWKDLPGVPMRIPVPSSDHDTINQTLVDLLRYRHDDEAKAVIYALVERQSGDRLAKTLHCSDTHARKLMKRMLDRLALEWQASLPPPDANDIERARKMIHRNIK